MKRLSRDAMRCLGRPVLVSIVMLFLGSTRAAGDIDPPGCNGNGVQLSISRTPGAGVNGQAINYKFSIANLNDPTTVACDATGVTVNFYCPGPDGTPNFSNPINLATGVNLPAGTLATALPPQTCTLNVNPGVTVATASVVAGQQTGNPNHACSTSDPCPEGALHDSATDDAFQSNKSVSVGVLTCTVQIDKQISCGNAPCTSDADCVTQTGDANAKCLSANAGQRCFVDVGFESNTEGGVQSCLGWNAFTVDGTSMPAEPVVVRYIANNTGGTRLFSCTATDTNTVLSSTAVPLGDVVTVSTAAEIDKTCSAELSASEPDTATVSCFCTADKNANFLATARDTAKFQCLTPGLSVTKTCLVPDANGNSEVDIELMNTGTADLANCVVSDNVFKNDPTCPPTGASTAVTVPGVASLLPGTSATVKGSVSGLTTNACNTASVTCEVVGSVDPATPSQPKKITATDSAVCEVPSVRIEKVCVAQDANGVNQMTFKVTNTGGVALANCAITDNIFTNDPTCPPTGAGTPVPTTPAAIASLDPGAMASATGSVSGLTGNACDEVSVTCDVVGATGRTVTATDAQVCLAAPPPSGCRVTRGRLVF